MLQTIVWAADLGYRSRPPRWNMIAIRNRSRFRYAHARDFTRWIFAFIDSPSALVAYRTTAFRMPSRCFRTVRPTRTIGSRRLRLAHLSHASHARRAHVRLA